MTLSTCKRCKVHLSNKKIPSQANANNMKLHPVPPELADLTQAEVRLISQVKVYMKMFILSRGKGQRACRGIVVHFPQDVTEVPTQLRLPLALDQADMVVVEESVDGVERPSMLSIRPGKVYGALRYLKAHNRLYENVVINETVDLTNIDSIRISSGQSGQNVLTEDLHLHCDEPLGYKSINGAKF